jgi:hypothetical protein
MGYVFSSNFSASVVASTPKDRHVHFIDNANEYHPASVQWT